MSGAAMDYLKLLAHLHDAIQPRAYLEIGVEWGRTLALSRARSVAIDPTLRLDASILRGKPWVKCFRTTSDAFFAQHSSATTLEGNPLDLAFIDGWHAFAQVVQDLEHVERWGHAETVVVIHDVLPRATTEATRGFHEGAWTGDVWRVVPFLRQHRPDLRCQLVDVRDTGALVVSGLDPAAGGMSVAAAALDRGFPGDGPEYEQRLSQWRSTVQPVEPGVVLRPLAPAPRPVGHRATAEGWTRSSAGWRPKKRQQAVSNLLRIVLDEPIAGSHHGTLDLRVDRMPALWVQLHCQGPEGESKQEIALDITHPGAAWHDLDSLWLDADPETKTFALDWETTLAPGEELTEIRFAPLDFWLLPIELAAGMAIDIRHLEVEGIVWPRAGTRFAAERFPDRPRRPKRKNGKRDAVIFAWWIPETCEARDVAEYYLGLLRYHHADSRIFVGVNHGSDPVWTRRLRQSGLDVEIATACPHVRVDSDVGGFLAALRAYHQAGEAFDLVWFGHTKGASRGEPVRGSYNQYRYQHDRRFWSRRAEIEHFFADPKIGLFSHRYGLHDSSPDAEAVPWRGFGDLDALKRIYREDHAPLGLWAWETVFVMRDSIVRRFCDSVGDELFAIDPRQYGAGRWWFEAAFPSIASMQGYEPYIELETDGAGSPREDVVLYLDPRQGNRLAMRELQRWRDDPFGFRPCALQRDWQ
jgi:hypothetical protein